MVRVAWVLVVCVCCCCGGASFLFWLLWRGRVVSLVRFFTSAHGSSRGCNHFLTGLPPLATSKLPTPLKRTELPRARLLPVLFPL